MRDFTTPSEIGQRTIPGQRVGRSTYFVRTYPQYACPTCKNFSSRDRVFDRRIEDLGNKRFANDVVVRYSQHYCEQCDRYFSVDITDLCPRNFLYTNRVIAQAVRFVLVLKLTYRRASCDLQRDFHVSVPFGTIHNWVKRFQAEHRTLLKLARKRSDGACTRLVASALDRARRDGTWESVEEYQSIRERVARYKELSESGEDLLIRNEHVDGYAIFQPREFTAWLRIIWLQARLATHSPWATWRESWWETTLRG